MKLLQTGRDWGPKNQNKENKKAEGCLSDHPWVWAEFEVSKIGQGSELKMYNGEVYLRSKKEQNMKKRMIIINMDMGGRPSCRKNRHPLHAEAEKSMFG